MSLRLRLTLFYTLFLAAVLTAVAFSVFSFTERSLRRELEDRARSTLQDLRVDRYGSEALRGLSSETEFLLRLRPTSPIDWTDYQNLQTFKPTTMLGARSSEGTVRFLGGNRSSDNSNSMAYRSVSDEEDLIERLSDSEFKELFEVGRVATSIRNETSRYIVHAVTDEFPRDEGLPGSYGVSFVGLPFPSQTLAQLRSLLIQAMALAFGVFAIGVWLLSNRVLLPVKRVTKAAKEVTGSDLSRRVPLPKSEDEMKELAVSINGMLSRLQESFETQRRFTADASHELRTPVTAIVGHANYLLRRTKPNEEQVDSLTVVRREGERMAKLVNDLLELARADAGLSIERDPMNLVEVVEAVQMSLAAVSTDTTIRTSLSEPLIEVDGDAARLKQVVLNLVQNAINAGSKTVTITLQNEKKNVRLEVLDDGPGIPAEAIPHLFDRFFRVDGARSTRGNGSGLGLAIVRWIVVQHDGTVEIESKVGEGTVFTVLLPRLDPSVSETNIIKQTLAGVRPPGKAGRTQAS